MADQKREECQACQISSGPPDWHYICRACKSAFTMPVPKGPTDEKNRLCPQCRSAEIERIKTEKTETCPPGG